MTFTCVLLVEIQLARELEKTRKIFGEEKVAMGSSIFSKDHSSLSAKF